MLGALKVGRCGPDCAGGDARERSKEIGGSSVVAGREYEGYGGESLVNSSASGEFRLQLRLRKCRLAAASGRHDLALKDFDGNVAGGYRFG